jgi:hypothetical protein
VCVYVYVYVYVYVLNVRVPYFAQFMHSSVENVIPFFCISLSLVVSVCVGVRM